jgi:hypothetical protein
VTILKINKITAIGIIVMSLLNPKSLKLKDHAV